MSSTCRYRAVPVSRWVGSGVAPISPREGRTALAMDVEEVHPAMRELGTLEIMGGDGAVEVDDAWGAVAPHAQEEDGRVPIAVERPLYGNVCFDGVEKHLEVPKNSD